MKVLQFSGGVDSLAALFLKRPEWGEITVMWCDTGAAYPETRDLMERVAKLVPHFHIARSDKPAWEKVHGIAVDLVPERYTLLGHLINATEPPPLYTSLWRCCGANIWHTLDRESRALGASVIIRGQRHSDRLKSDIRSGHVDPTGMSYEFPLEDWSREQVFDYCRRECPALLPAYYERGEISGHDCWDCLAYLFDNVQRVRNLDGERREIVRRRLDQYKSALQYDLEVLNHATQ